MEPGPPEEVPALESAATDDAASSAGGDDVDPSPPPDAAQPPPPSPPPPPFSVAVSPPGPATAASDRAPPPPLDLESDDSFMHPAASGRAEPMSSRSMLRRAQNRANELRRMFDLPASEDFLNDYMCALKKRVLLQGRMYVFGEHVCFHANLFGYIKRKVIPLARVTEVRKRKNVGFPNSIELTVEGGKREFFTSFLAREDAYRLVMHQWRQCSEHAPPPSPEPEPSAEAGGVVAQRSRSVSRLLRGMSSLVHRESSCGRDTPERGLAASSMSGPLEPLHEEGGEDGGDGGGGGGPRYTRGSAAGGADDDALARDASELPLGHDNSFIGWPSGLPAGPPAGGARRGGAAEADASGSGSGGGAEGGVLSGGEGEGEGEVWEFRALTDLQCQRELELEVAQSEPAPPVPPSMQRVLEFDLACPPLEFWSRFLANHSDFLPRFHAGRGDSSIRLGKWQRHYRVGMLRDMQFVHPVKARIGPPTAMCSQTQRLKMFAGRHLVLETSQVMSGIPYGDTFTVETRWDVAPDARGCRVAVHLAVPFSRRGMFSGFIERGAYDDTLDMVQGWRRMAEGALAAAPSTGLTPGGAEPQSEAEWDALLTRVDPRYRGAVQHLRRHSRAASLSQQGGVHVARRHHRRSASRGGDALGSAGSSMRSMGAAAAAAAGGRHASHSRSPSLSAKSGGGNSRAASFRNLEQLEVEGMAGSPGKQQQMPLPTLVRRPRSHLAPAAATAPLALVTVPLTLLGWLLGLLRGVVQALGGRRAAAWACWAAVVALQAAVILQQRRQLAELQQPAAGASAAAAAAAALGREVAQIRAALSQLQAQLDAAAGSSAILRSHLLRAAG